MYKKQVGLATLLWTALGKVFRFFTAHKLLNLMVSSVYFSPIVISTNATRRNEVEM